MFISFDTNELTPRDASSLIGLLSNIAEPNKALTELLGKDATRVTSHFKPEALDDTSALPGPGHMPFTEDAKPEGKKRGRPRKNAEEPTYGSSPSESPSEATEALLAAKDLADTLKQNLEPRESFELTQPAADTKPVTLNDIREVVNEHVSKHGMTSAQAVLAKFGAQRVSEIPSMDPSKQAELLAALRK